MESLDGGFASPSIAVAMSASDEAGLQQQVRGLHSQLTSPLTMAFDPNLIQPPEPPNVVLFNDVVSGISYRIYVDSSDRART